VRWRQYFLLGAVATSRLRLRLAQAARMAALLGVVAASVESCGPLVRPKTWLCTDPRSPAARSSYDPGGAVDGIRYGSSGSIVAERSIAYRRSRGRGLARSHRVYGALIAASNSQFRCRFLAPSMAQLSATRTRETDFSQTDPWSLRVRPPFPRGIFAHDLRKSYLVLAR